MLVLDPRQLLRQLVVLEIADRRRGVDVVTAIVLGQLVDEREVVLAGRN
jgi:hypothetical protein